MVTITVTLTAPEKALIERAAQTVGLTTEEFILASSVLEATRETP